MILTKKLAAVVLAIVGLTTSASALDFDFSGTFRQDNQIDSLFFTVGTTSTVTVFSSSWDDGGFDPILAIWDSIGANLAEQDDGHVVGSTLSNSVSYTHGDWDSYYSVLLGPGTYRATIAQFNNFSTGPLLSAGFAYDSSPHFTFTNGFGPQPDFNGVDGVGRTGAYVFHILNVESATHVPGVPDSSVTLGLLALGLAAMTGIRRFACKY